MSMPARLLLLSLSLPLASCAQVRIADDDGDDAGRASPPDTAQASPICGDAAPVELRVLAQNSAIDVMDIAPLQGCGTVIVGSYAGSVDFGGGSVSAPDWEGFVARYDAEGNVVWFLSIGSTDAWSDAVYDVVTDEDGSLYVAGRVDEPTPVGSLSVDGPFVLALDADGAPRWARPTAQATWNLTAGGATLDAITSAGESGIGRLRLDPTTGEPLLEQTLVTGTAGLFDVATRGDTTALAFVFYGTVEAFGQTLTARDDGPTPVDTQGIDLALASFDGEGSLRWLRTFDEAGFSPYLGRVAVGPDDGVALAFDFWGQINLGGGQHVAAPVGPGMAGVVGIFDATGQLRFDAEYGAGEFVFPSSLAWDPGGTLTLGGELYNASLGLGHSDVTTAPDAYLGFQGSFDSAGELLSASARPGFDSMFQAEPGVLFWVDRPTPDGVYPHLIELRREGVLPAGLSR